VLKKEFCKGFLSSCQREPFGAFAAPIGVSALWHGVPGVPVGTG
jgi:hypothetical protein